MKTFFGSKKTKEHKQDGETLLRSLIKDKRVVADLKTAKVTH
jgi:hypothetical protein